MSKSREGRHVHSCDQSITTGYELFELNILGDVKRLEHTASRKIQRRESCSREGQFQSLRLVIRRDSKGRAAKGVSAYILKVKSGKCGVVIHIQSFYRITISYDSLEFRKVRKFYFLDTITVKIKILKVRTILKAHETGYSAARAVHVLDILCLEDTDFTIFVVIEERQQILLQLRIRNIYAAIVIGNHSRVVLLNRNLSLLCGILHPKLGHRCVIMAGKGIKHCITAYIERCE